MWFMVSKETSCSKWHHQILLSLKCGDSTCCWDLYWLGVSSFPRLAGVWRGGKTTASSRPSPPSFLLLACNRVSSVCSHPATHGGLQLSRGFENVPLELKFWCLIINSPVLFIDPSVQRWNKHLRWSRFICVAGSLFWSNVQIVFPHWWWTSEERASLVEPDLCVLSLRVLTTCVPSTGRTG